MSEPNKPQDAVSAGDNKVFLPGAQAPRLAPWAEETVDPQEDANLQMKTLKKDMLVIFMLSFSVVGGVYVLPMMLPQRTMGSNASAHRGSNGRPLLMELRNCRVVAPAVAAPVTESVAAPKS